MQDNSINSDSAVTDSSKDGSGVKVYASLKSLSVNDGSGSPTPPAVGDDVELSVKGKVESIDGDVACVSPTEVNGEPAPQAPAAQSPDDEEAELRSGFGQHQAAQGY